MKLLMINIFDDIGEIQSFPILLQETLLLLPTRDVLYQTGNIKYLNSLLEETDFKMGAYYFQKEYNQDQFLDL